jgi:hypothetical protein
VDMPPVEALEGPVYRLRALDEQGGHAR